VRRFLANLCIFSVIAAHSLVAPSAIADGLEAEKAVALFQEGRRLAAQARYGEACERFEQSLVLADGIGTRFNLADCLEHLGRTASAQALFTAVAAAAGRSGQNDRARVARERAAALEARVARLSIEVESSNEVRPVVRCNGKIVAEEDWGKPLPVDPGTYRVKASAPDHTTFSRSIQVPATASVVLVTVPELARESLREEEETEVDDEPAPVLPEPAPPAARPVRRFGPAAIGLTALGLGGVAAGTVFLLKYNSANDEAKAICPNSVTCPRGSIDRHDELVGDAKAARVGTFVGFGIGGVALTAALVSFLVPSYSQPEDDADRKDDDAGVVFHPVVAREGGGVFASGRF
jgi:hypothetical protein